MSAFQMHFSFSSAIDLIYASLQFIESTFNKHDRKIELIKENRKYAPLYCICFMLYAYALCFHLTASLQFIESTFNKHDKEISYLIL